MILNPGAQLGPYEIISAIGAGGMGEVYRALDPRIGREVAIKVSAERFNERFEREARAVAALNHSNICTLYDVGPDYIVMELVEGETLADRIQHGAIPLVEALAIARQIADALEAAHEKGIIHRDLKPANIKIRPDGTVKVLDFGLAKVTETQDTSLSHSPTLSHLATQQGIILGTAGYMSPEQARGKPVDKRADIWAFGVVLYEMLTGKRLFEGDTVSDTLAAVLTREPEWDKVPARARRLLRTCLQKDPRQRLADISDAKLLLDEQPMEAQAESRRSKHWLFIVAIVVVLTSIIAGVVVWKLKPQETRPVTWSSYELPKDQKFGRLFEKALAVSPDGRRIAYATTAGICLRSMDELEGKLIPGTGENPQNLFFSPDGKWIGYVSGADGQMKKILISGGPSVTLTDAGVRGSPSWGMDDTIVFVQAGKGILRISANGGTPEPIVKEELRSFRHPQILPDGKTVLFMTGSTTPFTIMVQSLQSGERKELFPGDTPRYLPTGHIVYHLENNLMTVPFDLKTLRVSGEAVPVVEGVLRAGGAPQYAVSESGTLVYVPGGELRTAVVPRALVWVDKTGRETPVGAESSAYRNPTISPDGTKVALNIPVSGNTDIWVYDFARKTMPRLTLELGLEDAPVWTPDGKRIVYRARRGNNQQLYMKRADGTGTEELLRQAASISFPGTWSKDGRVLVDMELIQANIPSGNFDIGALSMDGERKWRPLLNERYGESQPRVSTDGRWLAYTSNESGKNEIYVRPFPDVGKERWQVSVSGGDSPLWSPGGRELFYRSGDEVMAVSVKTEPSFSPETARMLFRRAYVPSNITVTATTELSPWDITPDGKRFLMMKEVGQGTPAAEAPRRINIALDWFEELKQRVPTGNK